MASTLACKVGAHIFRVCRSVVLAEGGLKQAASFPDLRAAYVQRTHLREIPPALLHYHLHTLDLSFSSDVASGKLLHQFNTWAACKQPSAITAPIAAAELASPPRSEASSSSSSLPSATSMDTDSSSPPSFGSPRASASSSSSSSSPSFASPPLPMMHGSDPSFIQVRRLVLESCCVDNRVAALLGEFMRNLTHLNLTDSDVTGSGLTALAPLTRLRVLHVSGCRISNASVAIIGNNFKELRELYMDCATVTDVGVAMLKPLAGTLRRLDLFEASVGDAGLDKLSGFNQLVFLECCNGRVTNAGLVKIAAHLPALTSLNLSNNRHITDDGLEPLRLLTKLVHVNLSQTSVTHQGLAFLQDGKAAKMTAALSGAGTAADQQTYGFSGAAVDSALRNISLFGCDVKITSAKLAQLPPGVQIGIDAGIVSIE